MRGGKRDKAGRHLGSKIDNPRTVRWPVRWTAEEQLLITKASEKSGKSPTDIIRAAALEYASKLI